MVGGAPPIPGHGLTTFAAPVKDVAPLPPLSRIIWPPHLYPPQDARTLAVYGERLSVNPNVETVILDWNAPQSARLTQCRVAIDTSTATAVAAVHINGERRVFGLSKVVRANDLDLFDTCGPGAQVRITIQSSGTLAGVFVQLLGWLYPGD